MKDTERKSVVTYLILASLEKKPILRQRVVLGKATALASKLLFAMGQVCYLNSILHFPSRRICDAFTTNLQMLHLVFRFVGKRYFFFCT